jgi:hypothetical protein
MKQHNEFESQQNQELAAQHQAAQNAVQEFSTVEELLRHDTAQTVPPASIAQRLQKSSAEFPRPGRSWWKKLFGQ